MNNMYFKPVFFVNEPRRSRVIHSNGNFAGNRIIRLVFRLIRTLFLAHLSHLRTFVATYAAVYYQ